MMYSPCSSESPKEAGRKIGLNGENGEKDVDNANSQKMDPLRYDEMTIDSKLLGSLRKESVDNLILIVERNRKKFCDYFKENQSINEIIFFVTLLGKTAESKNGKSDAMIKYLLDDVFVKTLEKCIVSFFNQPFEQFIFKCPWNQSKRLITSVLSIFEIYLEVEVNRNSLCEILETFVKSIPILEKTHSKIFSYEVINKLEILLKKVLFEASAQNLQIKNEIRTDGNPEIIQQVLTNIEQPIGAEALMNLQNKKVKNIISEIGRNYERFYRFSESIMEDDTMVLFINVLGKILESKNTDKKAIEFLINETFVTGLEDFIVDFFNLHVDFSTNERKWNSYKKIIENVLQIIEEFFHCFGTKGKDCILETIQTSIPLLEKAYKKIFPTEIRNRLQILMMKKTAERDETELHYANNVDFRQILIYPSTSDVLSENCNEYYVHSFSKRPYKNVDDYLTNQFMLLKIHWLEILRRRVLSYRFSSSNIHDFVDFYDRVKFLKIEPITDKYCVRMLFDSSRFNKLHNFEKSRKFNYDSLVGFSRDNFKTIIFGRICDKNIEDINKGELIVEFHEFVSIDFDSFYTMINFKVLCQPYVLVLTYLKDMNEGNFPMEKYIIRTELEPQLPRYMSNDCTIDVDGYKLSPLEDWSCKNLYDLNDLQIAAFQKALTQEFAVIEGPPATGKTYIGIRIMKTLIDNKHLWYEKTPILVVCDSDNALDKFLDGLVAYTNSIVRIGGYSEYHHLSKFSLYVGRPTYKSALDDIKLEIKAVFEKLKEINDWQSILNFNEFSDVRDNKWFYNAKSDDILQWLLDDIGNGDDKTRHTKKKSHKINWDPSDGRNKEPLINLQSLSLEIRRLELLSNEFEKGVLNATKQRRREINAEISKFRARHTYLSRQLAFGKIFQDLVKKPQNIDLINPENMKAEDRWNLYFYWVKSYKEELIVKLASLQKQYQTSKRINDIRVAEKVKNALVVGMTVKKAISLRSLLLDLKSPVVLVEEASEILETHVVSCVTQYCQHLILIGDHQQFRPKIHFGNVHSPSTKKLRISLLERILLKSNSDDYHVLNVQHRMRPEISSLISIVYPFLQNHKSTTNRPSIKGVDKCLFFINHNNAEVTTNGSSKINHHEIHFFIQFAKYLISRGYKSQNITILSAYLGQTMGFEREKLKHGGLEGIRISVLDKYQGDENDIILLSMVRNNNNNSIGFLSDDNRTGVALSRARDGLYIIGNMEILCEESELWENVKASLEKSSSIGPKLPLRPSRCHHNQTDVKYVQSGGDFLAISQKSCENNCEEILSCGHQCTKACHFENSSHTDYRCEEICQKPLCDQKHIICQKKCYQKCDSCTFKVARVLPCGHSVKIKCHQNTFTNTFRCVTVVTVQLPCGHTVEKPCYSDTSSFKCPFPCEKKLICGHLCGLKCHIGTDADHFQYKCRKRCTKYNKNCTIQEESHKCHKLCFEDCEECKILVKKKKSCSHVREVPCHFNVDILHCNEPCTKLLKCGHQCKEQCSEKCGHCDIKVSKIYPVCGHSIKIKCFQEPDRKYCNKKCPLKLPCEHPCMTKCNEPCTSKCSVLVNCSILADCGHTVTQVQCNMLGNSKLPMAYCNYPCEAILKCDHLCSGSCSECYQGRFHKRCEKKCTNFLICNHRSESACQRTFEPCTLKCLNKCQHDSCPKKCFEICFTCKKKCARSCVHQKCTRMCGEICNVSPCNEPCQKVKECGHRCIGFCGDPCPPKCFSCEKESFDETERYVFLNDCKHIIGNSKMNDWLQPNKHQLGFNVCPICYAAIITTHRYSDVFKQTVEDISLIKMQIIGTREENEERRQELYKKFFVLKHKSEDFNFYLPKIKSVLKTLESQLQSWTKDRQKQIRKYQLETLSSKLEIIETLLIKCGLSPNKYIISQANFILNLLKVEQDYFTKQEVEDITFEVKRFLILSQFTQISNSLFGSCSKSIRIENIETEMKEYITNFSFSKESCKGVEEILKGLHALVSSEMKIMGDEDIKIFTTALFQKDSWFKCSVGHIHATDDKCSFYQSVTPSCFV